MTETDRMPRSAWVFAWLCLASQLVQLAHRGLSRSDAVWVFLSMALSALVLSWIAAGVLRGRTVRLVLVWILIVHVTVLTGLGIVVDLSGTSGWDLLDYLRWQRAHPDLPGPGIGGLVAIALVVGLLGGLTAPGSGDNPPTQLRVGL